MTDARVDTPRPPRLDADLIVSLVPEGAKVLDVGCGDGRLLADLRDRKGCMGRGIDIDEQAVLACASRGIAVYHGDMLEGMSFYRDGEFDCVILSQTLQQTLDPPAVLAEMLRVGRTGIISFPNFGHWRVRLGLLVTGRMPRTGALPYPWYATPNVHLCTVRDFRRWCDQAHLVRVREVFLTEGGKPCSPCCANWRAETAIVQVRPADVQAKEEVG